MDEGKVDMSSFNLLIVILVILGLFIVLEYNRPNSSFWNSATYKNIQKTFIHHYQASEDPERSSDDHVLKSNNSRCK